MRASQTSFTRSSHIFVLDPTAECTWYIPLVLLTYPTFTIWLSIRGINMATQLNKYGRRHSTNRWNSLSTNGKRYCSCRSISSSRICTKGGQHAETQVLWAEDVRKLHHSDSDLMQ